MAKLIFRSGIYAGKQMSLPEGKAIVLGRNRDVDLPLNDTKLSRRHCQLVATQSGCVITDLGSTNGTFINGTRLEASQAQELIEFDRIVLGDTEIELYVHDPGEKSLAISSDDNMPVVRISTDDNPRGPQSPTDALLKAVADQRSMEETGTHEILSDPDPLLAALYEIGLPLPPEPGDSSRQTSRVETVFCAYCDGKISEAERARGDAKFINNHWACKACISRPAKPGKRGEKVDALLAGLDQEPLLVDTSRGPRRSAVEHDADELRRSSAPTEPAHGKPDEFGEEFEEIG